MTTGDQEPTPFEKFRDFAKKIVSVPKSEIDRREIAYKKARKKIKAGYDKRKMA